MWRKDCAMGLGFKSRVLGECSSMQVYQRQYERSVNNYLKNRSQVFQRKGSILIRRQFPVKLAFAMTINKSQGQSHEKVGVFFPTEVFSHGQLYIALSRAKNKKGLNIRVNGGETRTTNVVDLRVLQ